MLFTWLVCSIWFFLFLFFSTWFSPDCYWLVEMVVAAQDQLLNRQISIQSIFGIRFFHLSGSFLFLTPAEQMTETKGGKFLFSCLCLCIVAWSDCPEAFTRSGSIVHTQPRIAIQRNRPVPWILFPYSFFSFLGRKGMGFDCWNRGKWALL